MKTNFWNKKMKYKLGVINEKGNKKDTKKRLKDYKKMFMNHIC